MTRQEYGGGFTVGEYISTRFNQNSIFVEP